jgi:non-ribosomal peptide synthetase component F
MKPVPVGVVEELYIAGDGLARGYWRRPDLTTARFVPHTRRRGRGCKTGDLVRYRADGNSNLWGETMNRSRCEVFGLNWGDRGGVGAV